MTETTPTTPKVYPPKPPEPTAERYARQTRNAAVFVAVVVGLFCAASLIVGIVVAVGIDHLANGSSGSVPAACQSQGGPVPGC